jgi:hypothetical protein
MDVVRSSSAWWREGDDEQAHYNIYKGGEEGVETSEEEAFFEFCSLH